MKLIPPKLFQKIDGATRGEILHWWEHRRLYYNLSVGIVWIVTWLLVLIAGSAAVKPGVDFEEPIAMLIGPIIYGIMANLFYSLGNLYDQVFYRKQPRVYLFKLGLGFSLALTALPGLWALTAWLITVVTGKKLD